MAQLPEAALGFWLEKQREWSGRVFGNGFRTKGIVEHIRKELEEIEHKPHDLMEWLDVVVLALDGYWRHGGSPERIMTLLCAKQGQNMARTWPPPVSEDVAVEHDRGAERVWSVPSGGYLSKSSDVPHEGAERG